MSQKSKRKYITKGGSIIRVDANGNETMLRASKKAREEGLVKPPKDKKKHRENMNQYRLDIAHKKRDKKLSIKSRKRKTK